MVEMPQNVEISQDMIDKLLNNPSFLDAVAKKIGANNPPKKVGGFVDANDISGGAFPQMSSQQLYNFAKAINGSVDQKAAESQFEALGFNRHIIDKSGITDTLKK